MRTTIIFFFILNCLDVFSQHEHKFSGSDKLYQINLFSSNSDPDIACYRIPSIVTATNGDIIVAIDERVPSCADLKWSSDINIVIRRSVDNGDSWAPLETVVDYPIGQSASDPSMIVDKKTGEIFLFFNFMDLENEKDVYYFKVVSSLDHGKTWSEPQDITSQISKPNWHRDFKFITSGRGIQTQSGKLLHTIVNLEKGLHVFGSDDHGKSWFLIDIPITPADESKIMELADGTWMINSRVNNAGIRYKHISTDHGQTWISSPDSALIDPGCNASILKYSYMNDTIEENWIVFANAYSGKSRENLTISLSCDNGKSWPMQKTIYKGSAAYSSLSVLSNGDIGLFFEANDYQDNFFVRFSWDWLTYEKE